MRLGFSWRNLLFFLIALILVTIFGVACAAGGDANPGVAYPAPSLLPIFEMQTEAARWLIAGAFLIVVIIFSGVALRRKKS